MKIRSSIILMAFAMAMPFSSNAQVGSILRNKLNKAINKEIETRADSAINKKAEEAQADQDDQQARPRGLGMGILGGKTDIKHNDEYNFTGRMHMIMESYDKKDVIKSDYFTYFNPNTLSAAIEVRVAESGKGESSIPSVFIFDGENRCFMMLMQGEGTKTGIISTIPDDSTLTAQSKTQKAAGNENLIITKTGNTKTIAGYKCDEYKVVDPEEDGYSNVWMTKDVRIKADKRNWGKAGMPDYYNYPEFEGSVMLAFEGYDKSNSLTMKMETREINENYKHSVSTVGYSFMKMNFGQAGKR
ncbi:MAG: DUF4412 domain-containing protein [Bacteroidales bacterium]|jgi:hypothetical protein|nr:DUF4412 domain-containing protein [Bacteroidales bacterium]